jgi:ribonuclease PH
MTFPDPPLSRPHGRAPEALRPLSFETGVMKFAEGSALIELGDTRVLVAATVESRVPPFLADSGQGWVTAEYAMLPRATHTRSTREVKRGRPSGRSAEIQRLIGRSLRSVVDLRALGERSLILDCDVLQADGGTRTAAISAAFVAAVQALAGLRLVGDLAEWPILSEVAAVSVGVVDGVPVLDLEYVEDQQAEVDLNVVATAGGELVEIQGTGEARPFRRQELDALVDLALAGIGEIVEAQRRALTATLAELEEASGPRRKAAPKDERSLWSEPK